MISVQPFTQPEFQDQYQKDIVDVSIMSEGSGKLKWINIPMEDADRIFNQQVDIMKLLDDLENRDEGFIEDEFAVWWNENKNTLNE